MNFTKIASRRTFGVLTIGILFIGLSAWKLDYFEINKQLDIFTNLFKEVNLYYVDETEPDALMEDAIQKMLKELDPYTVYIPEDDIEDFRIQQTGQYGGIGSTIRLIGEFVAIDQPYQGYAADKAGLKSGDLILQVDGKDVKGATPSQMSDLLKGSPGSSVKMTVSRYGEEFEVELIREEIQVKSVPYYGMLNDEVGYVVLRSFTDKASSDILEAIVDLKNNHGMKSLVLDLRGNPGGLLNEAINVSNLFLPKGQEVVSTRGRLAELDQVYKTLNQPFDKDMPLAVLISSGSASASEIVAGTIQDLDRGVVIGQRSYGKGLVQQSRPLSYGAQVKITIAKYYTPSGRCIQAINYAERNEDGSVARIPDSLRNTFTTAHGRTVLDGGGIDPDIAIETESMSGVLYSLLVNGHIFEYATEYVRTHPNISAPGDFTLSDSEYDQFVQFLDGKEYHYETETEKMIERLERATKNDGYNESLQSEINRLKSAYNQRKKDDLITFKDQISQLLAREIVGKYYYESGEIQFMLSDDPEVDRAIEYLMDPTSYAQLLAPQN